MSHQSGGSDRDDCETAMSTLDPELGESEELLPETETDSPDTLESAVEETGTHKSVSKSLSH